MIMDNSMMLEMKKNQSKYSKAIVWQVLEYGGAKNLQALPTYIRNLGKGINTAQAFCHRLTVEHS